MIICTPLGNKTEIFNQIFLNLTLSGLIAAFCIAVVDVFAEKNGILISDIQK